MLKASQFDFVTVQAVVFSRPSSEFSQNRVASHILGNHENRYDAPMQTIPMPKDVPQEIPRAIFHSQDNKWRIHFAPARIDSICSDTNMTLLDAVEQCGQVLSGYVEAATPMAPVKVGRLALIVHRLARVDNAARELVEHFCRAELTPVPFGNSQEFEIHNFKTYQLPETELKVNSWVRCKAAFLNPALLGNVAPNFQSALGQRVVVVEQDINTTQEQIDQRQFNGADIIDFFQRVCTEEDSIMSLYFPDK